MNKDNIWDRMKWYESNYDTRLLKRTPVIIRLDGRAFHTFTRWCEKPFDNKLIDAFNSSVKSILENIQWWKLAYHQSDEVSILITDYDTIDTQWYFDYRVNKINSIVAANMSNAFNVFYDNGWKMALFDCRCFNVPEDDIANYFLWRQKDRVRNSLQMLSRSYFSTKELHWKNRSDMHEMLHSVWVNWSDLDWRLKNWTYFTKWWEEYDIMPTFESINTLVTESLKYGRQEKNI